MNEALLTKIHDDMKAHIKIQDQQKHEGAPQTINTMSIASHCYTQRSDDPDSNDSRVGVLYCENQDWRLKIKFLFEAVTKPRATRAVIRV